MLHSFESNFFFQTETFITAACFKVNTVKFTLNTSNSDGVTLEKDRNITYEARAAQIRAIFPSI